MNVNKSKQAKNKHFEINVSQFCIKALIYCETEIMANLIYLFCCVLDL